MTGAPVVLKFGGAALGTDDEVGQVLEAVRGAPRPLVIVVSARLGVTDLLKGCLEAPADGARHAQALARMESLHPDLPPSARTHLRRLAEDLRLLETRGWGWGPRAESILAAGERLAAPWFASRLEAIGIPARPIQADRLGLMTRGPAHDPVIDLVSSEVPVRRALRSLLTRGVVPVVTGFIGRGSGGRVRTLGRGGSDYSATSLGYILRASRVELVKKDVSLLTADPRLVPAARPVERLSYEEAEELAQFGAKVLHPLTVEPARAREVELVVRSLDPPRRSTTIGPARPGQGVRALTLLSPTSILLLRVPGGRQRRGVIAEVSDRLTAAGVNVVTMFTSSALLCILVEASQGGPARRALASLAEGDGASLEGPLSAALVTAIGDGVVGDLGGLPRSVTAFAYGLSGTARTLSLAVPEGRGRASLLALHRALVERRGPRPTR